MTTAQPTTTDRISFSSAGAMTPAARRRERINAAFDLGRQSVTASGAVLPRPAEIDTFELDEAWRDGVRDRQAELQRAEHPPMFPPALPVGADLTAAYDAACERYVRDGVETDRIEAQRLGAELDR